MHSTRPPGTVSLSGSPWGGQSARALSDDESYASVRLVTGSVRRTAKVTLVSDDDAGQDARDLDFFLKMLHPRDGDTPLESAARQRVYRDAWFLPPTHRLSARVRGLLIGSFSFADKGYERLQVAENLLLDLAARVARRRTGAEWFVLWQVLETVLNSAGTLSSGRGSERAHLKKLTGPFLRAARSSRECIDPRRIRHMPMNPPPAGMLEDFVALVEAVDETHSIQTLMRRVGKGQTVTFRSDGSHYWSNPPDTPSLDRAITLVDERRWGGRPHAGARLGGAGDVVVRQSDTDMSDLAIYFNPLTAQPGLPERAVDEALITHEPWFFTAISLSRLAPGYYSVTDRAPDPAVDVIRALLNIVANIITDSETRIPPPPGTWSRYGYIQLSRPRLKKTLIDALVEGGHARRTAVRAAALLMGPEPETIWPVGSDVLVDLGAAAGHLQDAHQRAVGGAEGNAWGHAFETQLQSQIDRSRLAPGPELRKLAGKKVKRIPADRIGTGEALTDIDAVALTEDTLLLIDCKAYPATDGFLMGEPAQTRKERLKVEEAVRAWVEKINYIRLHPEVLGVHIPEGITIDGIVVVPDVPFVHIGRATERVARLYRASSAGELHDQLRP